MTHFETLILLEFLMPLVLAVSIYICKKYVDRKFEHQEKEDRKRHNEAEKRASYRRESDKINGDMSEASMELAYATSIAVERGKTNGEMKKARKMYEDAKNEREAFLKEIEKEITNQEQ